MFKNPRVRPTPSGQSGQHLPKVAGFMRTLAINYMHRDENVSVSNALRSVLRSGLSALVYANS